MEELKVPEEFKFPFTPYSIQIDFMRQLYKTVEAKKVGIFESPTGTGKFLKILEKLQSFDFGYEMRYHLPYTQSPTVYCGKSRPKLLSVA